jgi:hypothetical protein
LTSDIKDITDKINEIEHGQMEKVPDQPCEKWTLALDKMDHTIENLITKMDGVEEKLNNLGSSQSKELDESLDKFEGHIQGLKYKVDELSMALHEKNAIVDDQATTTTPKHCPKACNVEEKMDHRFQGLESLMEGQSLLLNQLVEENKKLASEVQCIAKKSNANDAETARNVGLWTPQEAADYKKTLEKIATDNFGNITSYINKNVILHLENLLRQRDEMLIDVIQKKAADIKKCIIEESNETHKVLEENLEQQKSSQIHATTAIMKNFNESIAKQTVAKKTAPPPQNDALFTKIDFCNEGMRNLIAVNTQKVLDKLNENLIDEKKQKAEEDTANVKWRQDLELKIGGFEKISLKKTLIDSFKDISNSVKSVETELKSATNKADKNHSDEKKQITNLTKKITEDLNKLEKKHVKSIDELSVKVNNNHIEVLTQTFFESFVQHFDKKIKEMHGIWKEILEMKSTENLSLESILNKIKDDLTDEIHENHSKIMKQNTFDTFVKHFDKKIKEMQTKLKSNSNTTLCLSALYILNS